MAKHLLDRAQVGAAAEEVRGEGVAQGVRRGPLRQASKAHIALQHAPEAAAAEWPAEARQEDRILAGIALELRPRLAEVAQHEVHRQRRHRHDPLLRALADGAHEALGEAQFMHPQRDKLRHAQP